MAEKWREVPGGSDHHPRQFSYQRLEGSDAVLSAAWSRQYEEASGLRTKYLDAVGAGADSAVTTAVKRLRRAGKSPDRTVKRDWERR